ncbi:hypothetical protein BS329_25910 [Amycolatopsis coloradensis]|uniref:DUF3631 domain-containing protein n=1 Tax=Amycolatopsis coloradensis TaxID=76021 RepID=A0A1R0KL57_9PSEU|nr:hypothetical protein BS329_25910 [Amycolatopsis coloradensis]
MRLLADVRQVFGAQKVDRMVTAELIRELHDIEDGPWTDLQGKPLDSRRLAKELERYLVRPKDLKVNGKTLKGYRIDGEAGLADAWSRYLPPLESGATSATSVTSQVNGTSLPDPPPLFSATSATGSVPEVADGRGTNATSAPGLTCAVASVAEVAAETTPMLSAKGEA